jgi:signal transduction histidine kinase
MRPSRNLSSLLNAYLGFAVVVGIFFTACSVVGLNYAYNKVVEEHMYNELQSIYKREQGQLITEFVNNRFYAIFIRGQILEKEFADKSLSISLSKNDGAELYSSKSFEKGLAAIAMHSQKGLFTNRLGEKILFIHENIVFGGENLGEVVLSSSLSKQSNPILTHTLYSTIAVMLLTIVTIFLSLKRFLNRCIILPIRELISILPSYFAYGRGELSDEDSKRSYDINANVAEICKLKEAIEHFAEHSRQTLVREESNRKAIEKQKAINEIAAQVAHDIRSPLAAINVVLDSDEVELSLPPDMHFLLKNVAKRIQDIAANLMHKRTDEKELQVGASDLLLVLRQIIQEKKIENRSGNLLIELNVGDFNCDYYSDIQPAEFKRIISNLLNNAIEAIPTARVGVITVCLRAVEFRNKIEIIDNGDGIDAKIKDKIFERGVSFGKKMGTGLGLSHAKSVIDKISGTIEITNNVTGTNVTLYLPRVKPPIGIINSFLLDRRFSDVVIIDDDPLVHETWKIRLSKTDRKCHYFFSCEDYLVKKINSSIDSQNVFFFCDYDFLSKRLSGLDFLIQNRFQMNSILVTNQSDNLALHNRARQNGIKTLPKYLLENVRFG